MNQTDNIAVFQCRFCNLIIGDSFSLVTVNNKSHSVTLSLLDVINCYEDPENKILTKDKENPTIYRDIKCKCGKVIGIIHISVGVKDKDLLRNYSFESKNINTYQLQNSTAEDNKDKNSQSDNDRNILGEFQYLLISLTERIERIESQLNIQ